jgi:ribonuclease P protein component
MLANENRFHGPNSLRNVYKNGKTVHSHIFKVKFVPNRQERSPRFAVVVSKKVHKSAVGRNRMRRRVYEVIRKQLPQIKNGMDVVVTVVSGEALHMPFHDIESIIQQLFTDADIYTSSS